MSRSNQNENFNPCTKWYDWNGGKDGGHPEFYDKTKDNGESQELGGNIKVPLPFTFIVLDQLATIKGWHKASNSSIWSNEIRNSKETPFTVKSYKGGLIAQGLYENIKEKVKTAGGNFTANIYIGYKNSEGKLVIGSIQFKGAALNAWVEFTKANRNDLMKKAVIIKTFKDGKNGAVDFRTPVFSLNVLNAGTDEEAINLDKTLQAYLIPYLAKTASVEGQAFSTPVEEKPVQSNEPVKADAPVKTSDAVVTPSDEEVPF